MVLPLRPKPRMLVLTLTASLQRGHRQAGTGGLRERSRDHLRLKATPSQRSEWQKALGQWRISALLERFVFEGW